jgi:RHS repeat-associated protein
VRSFSRGIRRVLGGLMAIGSALVLVTGIALLPPPAASAVVVRHDGVTGAPVTKAASESTALAAMRVARSQHSRVEIMSDRTSYSQTFANPNGTTTYVASWQPRWVKRGSLWVPVNVDLVRESDGTWSPKASLAGLRLSGGGTGPLARISAGSYWLAVSWPGILPKPMVSGDRATYANVLPGVDLVVTAAAQGSFDETLVVRTPAAARNPKLRDLGLKIAAAKGLSVTTDSSGAVTVRTVHGAAIFTSPGPLVWDSSGRGADVTRAGTGAHPSRVGVGVRPGTERLLVPAAVLTGSRVRYPVYIDPSYSATSTALEHVMVSSAAPTSANWTTTEMGVGYTGSAIERSYFEMSMPSAIDGATILSATFSDKVTNAETASSTSHTVTLHSSDTISQGTTTWNDQPNWGATPVSETFTTASTTPNTTVNWDATARTQDAATSDSATWEVALTNSSETSSTYWVAFAADPTISITYDHAPTAPTDLTMSPQYWATDGNLYTSSTAPSFSATTTDPDGDNVEYRIEILTNGGSTLVASGTTSYVASGTSATWSDTTPLTDGDTYTYHVQAYDGTELSSVVSSPSFTVETDKPAAVAVTCSGYPSATWSVQVTGGTTCSWNAPLSRMNGYVVNLDGAGSWTTTTSTTINPGLGLHTLTITPMSAAGLWGSATTYSFGVGTTGAMTSPADGSQTSTTVSLQADAPPGYTSATFEYREGTTGSFQPIPDHVVYDCGCAVTWPVSTSTNGAGVQTDNLTWYVTRTLADDGPVQIEALFTDGSGDTDTTPPVTVTLDRIGTGADYGTTTAGPVTVGLQSGNAAASATDVNIASYGSSLSVTRTFNSLEPNNASIFGWGWTSSLTGGETTTWTQITNDGSYVVLAAADGSNDTFIQGTSSGGVTTYDPEGDAVTSGLSLTENTSASTFTLTDSSGTVTTFKQANSAAGYVPQTVTVSGDSSSSGIVYDGSTSDGTYGDPLLMVAPDAASSEAPTTACPYPASAATWTAGCRGLEFTYNSNDDVSQISFVYVDNSGNFHDAAVADYGYDSAGELTSEWDPRLATPLVTGYTYDETASDPDYGRITQISPAQAAGSNALAPWTLTYDDTSGDVNYGKVLTISRTHSTEYGGQTATTTIDYSVPLTSAAGGPIDMSSGTVATWDQTDVPTSAAAIFPPNHVPSSPPTATDYEAAQIDYYDADGREVNTASYVDGAWAVTTTQYDTYGNTVSTLSAADRTTALASSSPSGTAYNLSTVNVYGCDDFGTVGTCTSSDQQYQVLTDTYGPARNAEVDGTVETIRTHTAYTYDQNAPNGDTDSAGDPYMLTTSQTVSASIGASLPGSSTADARTTDYTYGNSSTDIGWTLGSPLTTVTDPGGLNITSTSVYNTSSSLYGGANLQTDSDMPSDTSGGGAGDTRTVYYTAGTNSLVAACGNKPEWADLTCQTGPAAQPGTSGLPNLPVTTYTYDDYLNVATKTETFGTTGTRVTTATYDSDERPSTQMITVSGTGMGTAVPETRTVYSPNAGLVTDTQTLDNSGTVTADINTTYDDFGELFTYTDASHVTTNYGYNIAGQVTSQNDGDGTDTYSYDTSGLPTSEVDSQAGTFTATYNPDGNMVTETYPGGITGTYTYDPTGTATEVSYAGPDWTAPLTDTVTPNAAGDWAAQSITDTATSLVSTQDYGYDNADRLVGVQDSEAGQCTTRAYTYDADSNRLGLTSYAPNSGGTCQSTSGTTTTSTYDSADRITNLGYTYDTQGDITTTPSFAAGANGNLTATYYANDMLASQTQNGATESWTLDPTLGRFATYSQGGVTYTNHYSGGGNSPAWVSASNDGLTRNVTDFNGLLAAEITGTTVTLELPDLHDDIMGTCTTSATSTGPTATYVYTEFGTPESGTPGTYGWLGADEISSDALGGQLLMGARAYNTNTGSFSQVDPVSGGSANAYAYVFQNPATESDPTGMNGCSWTGPSYGKRYCWVYVSEDKVKWLERHIGYLWATSAACGFLGANLVAGACILLGVFAGLLASEMGPNDYGHGEWLNVSEWRFVIYYPVGITWYGSIIWRIHDDPWIPDWMWFSPA